MAIRFDLNTLVPGGVTLHELISNAGVPGVADFPIGLAFGGNCLAVTGTRIGNSPEFGYIYYLTNLPNMYIVAIPRTGPAGQQSLFRCCSFERTARRVSRISAGEKGRSLIISFK